MKKDIVASAVAALGILFLFLFVGSIRCYEKGKAFKCYVERDWQRTRSNFKIRLKRIRGGDDPNVRYE